MLDRAIDYLVSKICNFKPEIGIVLGSGLGEIADEYCDTAVDAGGEVGDFPVYVQELYEYGEDARVEASDR